MIAWFATLTLALAVLFRFPSDYRMSVSIIVSVAAAILAVRCLLIGKAAWALLFMGILGIFTPFQISRLSHGLISVLDMASLALFAASPLILRKATMAVMSEGKVVTVRRLNPLTKWSS